MKKCEQIIWHVMGGDIKMMTLILQLFYFYTLTEKWCIAIVISSSFFKRQRKQWKITSRFVLKNSFVFRSLFKTLNAIFAYSQKH